MSDNRKWELRIPVTKSVDADVPTEIQSLAGLLKELVATNLTRGQAVTVLDVLDPQTQWKFRGPVEFSDSDFTRWLDETADRATDRHAPRGARERRVTFGVLVDQVEAGEVRFHIPDIAQYASGLTVRLAIDSGVLGIDNEEERQLHARIFNYSMQRWQTGRPWMSLYSEVQRIAQRTDESRRRYQDLEIETLPMPLALPRTAPYAVGVWSYIPCTVQQLNLIADSLDVSVSSSPSHDGEEEFAVLSIDKAAASATYYRILNILGYSTLPEIEAELARIGG